MMIKGGMFSIGVMRPDGSDERLLTRSSLDESPTWAPNGRVIMFSREDSRSGRTTPVHASTSAATTSARCRRRTDASDPDWSPTAAVTG